jgi:hypothetical protein
MREPHLEVFHQDEDKKHYVYRFHNGYGASVVQGPKTHGGEAGLWELAVVRFGSPHPFDFRIDRTTSIGDEVHGHLEGDDVDALLTAIEQLESGACKNFA